MKSGTELIREHILTGKPFDSNLATQFGKSSALTFLVVKTLKGQGAVFDEQRNTRPDGKPDRSTYRMVTPPTEPGLSHAKAQERVRAASALAKAKAKPSGAHTGRAQRLEMRLLAGEIIASDDEGASTSMGYLRSKLAKRGYTVVKEKDATRRYVFLYRIANLTSINKTKALPSAPVVPAQVVEPEQIDPPAWGSLLKVAGLIESEEGELHMIVRQNGHAWMCVVVGKAEPAQ